MTLRQILAAVLAFSLWMSVSSFAVSARASQASRVSLTHIAMVDTKVGWGTTPNSVLRTADGGRKWRPVLRVPRPPSTRPMQGPFFAFASIGDKDAWAVSSSTHGLRTYRSRNGGSTWTYSQQPFSGDHQTPFSGELIFADAVHGWLLLQDGATGGNAPQTILRTTNAGRRWTRVEFSYFSGQSHRSLPLCNGAVAYLSFVDATKGWATGMCGPGPQIEEVFGTSDGGHTWRQAGVPTPGFSKTYFDAGPVIPVGVHRPLLLPVGLASPPAFVLYRSIDGGLSWKPTSPVRGSSPYPKYWGPQYTFGPLTNLISWVMMGNKLRRTTDGGIKWQVMAKHLAFIPAVQLDFVDRTDGFALGPSTGRAARLYITRDSGRHWRKVETSLAQ